MPIITITERDILRGKIVEPAWYRVKIDEVGERTTKSGDSQFYPVEGTILFNADTGDETYKNVPSPAGWGFSEKAMGFVIGFLQACGAEIVPGKRYDLSQAAGKEIDVYIENGIYEGRTVNRINHKYRPIQSKE